MSPDPSACTLDCVRPDIHAMQYMHLITALCSMSAKLPAHDKLCTDLTPHSLNYWLCSGAKHSLGPAQPPHQMLGLSTRWPTCSRGPAPTLSQPMSLARLSSWCHMAGVCDSCSFSWLKNTARPHRRQYMQPCVSLSLAQWLVTLHALHCKHSGHALSHSCRKRCHIDVLDDSP